MKMRQSKPIYISGLCLFSVVVIFGMFGCQSSSVRTDKAQRKFNVGYRVLDIECRNNGQSKLLTVAVWYPTKARPKSYNYGGPTYGNVAVDAPPDVQNGPYPLLVFSHGYGGSGLNAVFFTEALAARGWIVAAPDHHDRYFFTRIRTGTRTAAHWKFDLSSFIRDANQIAASTPEDRSKYLYRLDEMRCTLDGLIASRMFNKLIDQARIAVGGHSFGGYTALGLCGTIPERLDQRIKGVLLFSTGAGGYLFTEDELKRVSVPSLLFMGEREKNELRGNETMAALSAKIFRNVSVPKYFLEIMGATHFSFNNRFSRTLAAKRLSGNEEQFEVIRKYSIAFLEKYVAGKEDLDHVLERERSAPLIKRFDTKQISFDQRKCNK